MSHSQKQLGDFGTGPLSPTSRRGAIENDGAHEPKLGFESRPTVPKQSQSIAAARNASWIVHTGRYPHIFDAARLGFVTGHREDLSYGWTPEEVTLKTSFLDNDYEDPDLNRFVEAVHTQRPDIAVIGDIYRLDELQRHLDAAEEIWSAFPDIELILVPKCKAALEAIPEPFVLGFPNGSSNILAEDVAPISAWREQPNRLHILGGTPLSTQEKIDQLTQKSLTGEPPADIAGLDWNGYQRYAQERGDYSDATGGWHDNLRDEYYAKRDLIRWSLLNAKHFYVASGIWPTDDIEAEIAALPLRDELQTAASNTTFRYEPTAHRDIRTLQSAPGWVTGIDRQPLFRTDDSQDVVFEPLSPLADLQGSSRRSWRPAGKFTDRTTARVPECHEISTICPGCGIDIRHRPARTRGADSNSLTAQVVSYEHHRVDDAEHYDSARRGDVEDLSPAPKDGFQTAHPTVQVFCSGSCRSRVEIRAPNQLLHIPHETAADIDGHIQGTPLGEIEIPLR